VPSEARRAKEGAKMARVQMYRFKLQIIQIKIIGRSGRGGRCEKENKKLNYSGRKAKPL